MEKRVPRKDRFLALALVLNKPADAVLRMTRCVKRRDANVVSEIKPLPVRRRARHIQALEPANDREVGLGQSSADALVAARVVAMAGDSRCQVSNV